MNRRVRMILWVFAVLLATVGQASAADMKRVLVLYSFGRDFEPWHLFSQHIQAELAKKSTDPIDFYEASIFSARFEETEDESSLVAYLRNLFARRPLDLIITMAEPAMQFVQKHREEMFPGTPMLITGIGDRRVRRDQLTPIDTVASTTLDFKIYVENILRVRPETRNIVFVMGNSRLERYWTSQLRQSFEASFPNVGFTWWNNLSVAEMARQAARLTPQSAILYTWVFVDADGKTFPFDHAFAPIRKAASVPIFGFADYHLGHGVVGGPLVAEYSQAVQTAEVAFRMLNGEAPSSIQVPPMGFAAPRYDWRELRRWNIGEDRLPPGSVVMFREPPVWTKYRWQIAAIVAVVIFQALSIAWLLYQRQQRRLAEATSRERMAMLTHMNRRAGAGELSASIAHEVNQPLASIVSNADAALLWLNKKTPDLKEAVLALKDIVNDGRRASEVISTIRAYYGKEEQVRAYYEINELVGEVLALLQSELRQNRISMRNALTDNIPLIYADRVQIQQVILNLVLNAIEALNPVTDRAREVQIRTEADKSGDVLLSVEDCGPGIGPHEIARIFQPFYTTKHGGMGMGLTICRSIVEDHGGQLSAAPGKPHGMAFRVVLPGVKSPPAGTENRQPVENAAV